MYCGLRRSVSASGAWMVTTSPTPAFAACVIAAISSIAPTSSHTITSGASARSACCIADVFGVSRKHVAVLSSRVQKPDCSTGAISKRSSTTAVFRPAAEAPPARREAASFAAARRTRDQQPHAGCAQQRTQNGVAGTQARASHAQIDGRDIFERKGSAAIHECRTAHARPVPARQRNKAVRDAIRKTVHRISADGLKAVLHQRVRRRQHACIRFFSPTAVYGTNRAPLGRAKRHRAGPNAGGFP